MEELQGLSIAINSVNDQGQHPSDAEIEAGHNHQKKTDDQRHLSAKGQHLMSLQKRNFLKIFVHTQKAKNQKRHIIHKHDLAVGVIDHRTGQ